VAELAIVSDQVLAAATAEDVFGAVDEHGMVQAFRHMSRILHPDRAGADARAADAMKRLLQLRDEAVNKFARGTYGQKKVTNDVVIRARGVYRNVVTLAPGDLFDVYAADYEDNGQELQAVIKLLRDPRDEDLATAEWRSVEKALAVKGHGVEHFKHYLPRPIETAKIAVGGGRPRRANIFRRLIGKAGRYSLAEVLRAYPAGIDVRDMAWMWRRILEVLSFVHERAHIVHGAVLPDHVLIDPVDHSARLIDWSYSVPLGQRMKAIPTGRADWYPPEVTTKGRTTGPGVDIYTSAKIALALVGGDIDKLPVKVSALLRACLIPSPSMRHSSVVDVYKRFDEVLTHLYGPPVFRPFTMQH
jgi:hypothetical protein